MDAEGSPTMQKVVEMTRAALDRGDSALLWAVDVARCLQDAAMDIPSIQLGQTLVTCVFSLAPLSTLSTYLHHAMAAHLVSSFHILGLLTPRVLQNRLSHPELYTMYLELTGTYIFHLGSTKAMPCCDMVIKAVDEVLQRSLLSGMAVSDFGTAAVKFVLFLVWRLMDATLKDLDLSEKRDKLKQNSNHQEISMAFDGGLDEKQRGECEQVCNTNCIAAINVVAKMMQNKKTLCLLRLARRNLLDQWRVVTCCLQSLEALTNDVSFTAPKGAVEAITHLIRSFQQGLCQELKPHPFPVQVLVESRTNSWSFGNCSEVGRAAAWLPIDIFMEDVMVGRRIRATPVVEALAELVKSLQSLQNALWHDTFLALWISALRLLQRELDNVEGPRPQSESRLCIPLSIVPLTSALLIEEEEKQSMVGSQSSCIGASDNKEQKDSGKRRAAFTSSLKILGHFEGLISPPQHVAIAAHQAAASAAAFVAGFKGGSMAFEGLGTTDGSSGTRTVANLRHLIVEACIARGLIDTSAYYWPGYLGTLAGNLSLSGPPQTSPWNAYMDGASLSGSLKSSLITTPAKCVAELEKIYQAAVNGPEDERPAAASILCGASLMRGWNVQEHAVHLVLRLISPPASVDSRVNGHFLIPHAPMLHATLVAIYSDDVLHILSLYGMFPELVAALLPICEVFGSLSPLVPLVTGSKEEISVLTLFSLAFLILIKIWKFHRPPLEHRTSGRGMPLGTDTSLEYLLMRHNMQMSSLMGTSFEKTGADDQNPVKKVLPPSSVSQAIKGSVQASSSQYITMDSFPKLKAWSFQHQSGIASSFSGLARGDSVHQVVDRLLSMMMRRTSKGGSMPTTPGASVDNTGSDDAGGKPLLPAWDLLAAVPFVVDALLTACGHGKLSPRDLTTGLKDLVDFFPASLASIASYLEAEVTRGLWKPASMNGKDWPSPSANLLSIETEIRDMLAASGADIPSSVTGSISGNLPVTLPLPLAALLSLTITFKVDKLSEVVLSVAGPALQNIAGSSPWPSRSVVAALWAQKVRRWHDFIVFGSAQSAIKKDKNAAAQLLRSCFAVTLGTSSNQLSKLTAHGGVGALLGHGNWVHALAEGRHPIPPGILYLHICPFLHDTMFLPGEIVTLLVNSVRESCAIGNGSTAAPLKSGTRLRCLHPSLATIVSRISQASTLAAALLFVSGGTTLVHLLYTETLPTWFLSGQKSEELSVNVKSGSTALLEGYAMAYFALLSGVLVWGVSQSKGVSSVSSPRKRAVVSHMRFLAAALDGKMSLACDLITWKAYITGFISLVLACAFNWISDVDVDTLRRVAVALRMWHEHDLAAALLERGGPAAMGAAGEFGIGS